jgi:hypothetical protein
MKRFLHLRTWAAALACLVLTGAAPRAAEISFNRDVRPILSDKCFACHGFDPKTREADRRIDTAEGAYADIDGIRAIVPGDLAKSDAWVRIISDDKDEVMPPPKSHKTLTAEEKETLKRWIEQGAKYQRHWAFEPPQRAPQPAVKDKAWVRNPVDAFVLAGLERAGLAPAPEADRRALARRVSLDLLGLPPTPEEVEAFVKDAAPDAYERLVAKLMARPQWGEHRGRYWLDAARYADTHGLHFDKYREIWPYRDWVIAAFNRNQRFDEFTVEQLAGDLFPKPTREQLIATGFHRCNPTTNEGGTIDEENLANYAHDRVSTTSWVWLGLTANCASCHDHKFDPITSKDFYSMAAFFRNTTQPPKDGNIEDTKPVVYLPLPGDEKRFAQLGAETAKARTHLAARRPDATRDFEVWLKVAKPEDVEVNTDALVVRLPLDEGAVEVRAETAKGETTFTATGPIDWRDEGRFGRAPAFTNGSHFILGDLADFERDQPFSIAAWVNVPENSRGGSIVARLDDRSGAQGWELYLDGTKYAVQLAAREPAGAVRAVTRANTVRPGKWQHVLATYDGSGEAGGLRLYVDGRPQTLVPTGNPLKGSTRAAVPLRLGQREKRGIFQGGQTQDVRIYARELTAGEARSLPNESSLRAAFAVAPAKRTPAQRSALLNFYIDNLDAPSLGMAAHIAALEDEDADIRERATVSHIQEEKAGSEPMAHVLMRGAYDKEGEKVGPAGFSALHPMPPDAPKNRLGLAQWIVAPENPLTARVTVNRFWQEVFGTGIVRTAEDFGSQGDSPVHPELLDWLAVEFRESGWDVKKLFTLLVTSATYRQAATTTPEKLAKDPHNRLLSRGPRFRMDAEMIRDYALATSSTLSLKMGGPGTKPYQPPNVWEVVGVNTEKYVQDKGESLYRRTVYNFWKRMAPPASMDIFNAPARETCVVRRERTNTPLQALVTLNDPQFVEASRRLAETAWKESGDRTAALDRIAARVLLRPLSDAEREVVTRTMSDLERDFAANAQGAKAYLSVGDTKPDPNFPAPQLAALTMVANQLLNLDEALNK